MWFSCPSQFLASKMLADRFKWHIQAKYKHFLCNILLFEGFLFYWLISKRKLFLFGLYPIFMSFKRYQFNYSNENIANLTFKKLSVLAIKSICSMLCFLKVDLAKCFTNKNIDGILLKSKACDTHNNQKSK